MTNYITTIKSENVASHYIVDNALSSYCEKLLKDIRDVCFTSDGKSQVKRLVEEFLVAHQMWCNHAHTYSEDKVTIKQ